jgi:hypothetical protein
MLIFSGCTTQLWIGYHVNFTNTCDFPVKVSVPKYFRIGESVPLISTINKNEIIEVLNFACSGNRSIFIVPSVWNELQSCLPDDYRLDISANANQRGLNKAQFMETLKHAKLFSKHDNSFNTWTISDPTLCP